MSRLFVASGLPALRGVTRRVKAVLPHRKGLHPVLASTQTTLVGSWLPPHEYGFAVHLSQPSPQPITGQRLALTEILPLWA